MNCPTKDGCCTSGGAEQRLLVATVLICVLTVAGPVAAQQSVSPSAGSNSDDTPALLVLLVATDSAGKAREQRFMAELELALEGVRLVGVDPGMSEFASTPLAAQIVSVRELLDRHRGVAATWLNSVSADLILLHMVVLSSGRALVRLVEGNPQRTGFAVDLAMAARELLGTAFLFNSVQAAQKPLARVVEAVREKAAPEGSHVRHSPWSVVGRADVSGGLAGFKGPSLQIGGALAVERRLFANFRGRMLLQAQGGPLDGSSRLEIRSLAVAPGVGASYMWKFGSILLGPALDLWATWTNRWVQATPSSTQGFALWSFRADIGPELRVPIGKEVSLLGGASIGATPLRQTLTLQSTDKTVYASPFLSWQAVIGFVLQL